MVNFLSNAKKLAHQMLLRNKNQENTFSVFQKQKHGLKKIKKNKNKNVIINSLISFTIKRF